MDHYHVNGPLPFNPLTRHSQTPTEIVASRNVTDNINSLRFHWFPNFKGKMKQLGGVILYGPAFLARVPVPIVKSRNIIQTYFMKKF